jgi:hypothetical protein
LAHNVHDIRGNNRLVFLAFFVLNQVQKGLGVKFGNYSDCVDQKLLLLVLGQRVVDRADGPAQAVQVLEGPL